MNKMNFPTLPVVLIGVVMLIFMLLQVIPWQMLLLGVFVAVVIFAFLGHIRLEVEKEQRLASVPRYHPPQQQAEEPESPIRPNLRPDFDLSPEEYNQLSKQYQQGYQAQPPRKGRAGHEGRAQPKQDRPIDYEQPQAQYPEHP